MTPDSRDSKTELKINLPVIKEGESDASYLFQPFQQFTPRITPPNLTRAIFNRYDFALIVSIFILALGSVLLTISAVGFSWDEAYYYEPAKAAVDWLQNFFSNPITSARKDSVDYAFAEVNELPAVCKFALGLSQRLFADIFGEFFSMRVAPAIAFALALVLIYLIGFNIGGRIVAIAGVIFYGLMPRVFGHAHIAATESLANFTILLTTWLFLKSVDSNRTLWAIFCAIAG
ncbi:MAG: glycosyltransferase family 39 protein, partial [Candidatus Sumerlaeia bacterium]|nr:glycosyltransferase family 39 protein [Candidatus Sumerlaeia bacterium]